MPHKQTYYSQKHLPVLGAVEWEEYWFKLNKLHWYILDKGDKFCNFPFVFQHRLHLRPQPPSETGSTLKGKILLQIVNPDILHKL